MSFKKLKFMQVLQAIIIIASSTTLGWISGLASGHVLICVALGVILGLLLTFRLNKTAKKILTIVLSVPFALMVLISILFAVAKLDNYIKLQKIRTYYVQEANFSFRLAPQWQARANPEAAVLPYLFDLGGGYRDNPHKTVTLMSIQPPITKEALMDNGGSVEILDGNAVSEYISEFERDYNTKGSDFSVDGVTGVKLTAYDDIDKVEKHEYLFYLAKSNKTALFYYGRKQNAKPFENDFENLVRSIDF